MDREHGARFFQGSETRQIHATRGTRALAAAWYYEPVEYEGDVLWSEGYATRAEAVRAWFSEEWNEGKAAGNA